jgi:hypothetical protein
MMPQVQKRFVILVSAFLFLAIAVAFFADERHFSISVSLQSLSSPKSYVPDSWMTPRDAEESPLLHSFVKSATFGTNVNSKFISHETSLHSPVSSVSGRSISQTEQLASSPPLAAESKSGASSHSHDSALRRLTTKAEKLGKELHDHGVQAPTKSEWQAQVHAFHCPLP